MLLRFCIALIISTLFGCSTSDEPTLSVVETLEVSNSLSSSRTFRGNLGRHEDEDIILSYGFEWESRYGSWKAEKPGKIKIGNFSVRDTTRLSQWTTYSVRAFIQTARGTTYGNRINFATEGK